MAAKKQTAKDNQKQTAATENEKAQYKIPFITARIDRIASDVNSKIKANASVTIGNHFQSSLETTCLLKELGAKFVVSRAERDGQAKFLLRNGADEVVYPEKQIAKWAAIRYTSNHILDYIELDDAHSIFEVTIPKEWLGMSIGQIDIRKKYNINIIALKDKGQTNVSVTPDTLLTADKTMLVLGEDKALQKCFHIL